MNDDYILEIARLQEVIEGATNIEDALRAENSRLRAALEAVEWVNDDLGEYCPECKSGKPRHDNDCKLQAALKGTP